MPLPVAPLFCVLPPESQRVLDRYDQIIQSVLRLSLRQRAALPLDVRSLSHRLTDERSARRASYLNEPAAAAAYVSYFHWWNLVRLSRLFAGLPSGAFALPAGGVCVDLGSGPLTVPQALWLARPELRRTPLTWYCVDRSRSIMALGESLYLALAARTAAESGGVPWRVVRVHGEAGIPLRDKAQLVASANALNETTQRADSPPRETAARCADTLLGYAEKGAALLLAEPGIPPSARFLSLLRGELLARKCGIGSPCPQIGECPMNGRRGKKWCHFAFGTGAAPKELANMSASAGLPKARASLSFLLAYIGREGESASGVRVVSDPIRLPGNRTGFYACSRLGLTLLEARNPAPLIPSGSLIRLALPEQAARRDRKTGAAIINIDANDDRGRETAPPPYRDSPAPQRSVLPLGANTGPHKHRARTDLRNPRPAERRSKPAAAQGKRAHATETQKRRQR